MNWYEVTNVEAIDSPALLVYPDRVQHNIETMIANVGGNPKRLCPHVKTYKMREIVQMQLTAGIDRFKCATISEMEMAITAGAKNVLIAYQMTGPKIGRLLNLAIKFPEATIASLVDNLDSAKALASTFAKAGMTAAIYLDVDNGLNRTGCPLDAATFSVIKSLTTIPNLAFKGLHLYDGQFRSNSMIKRKKGSDEAFRPIYGLLDQLKQDLNIEAEVINGGSPSFSSAAMRANVFCSPGTVLLWDVGYATMIPEVNAKWAAVLMTRIISKPTEGIITVDLGHKSVGSENPMHKRVQFLNLSDYENYSHSEEHLMIKVKNWAALQVGDVLYGVPYHVCPSVALHDEACVIREHEWVENWEVVARRRRLTV
ncbi:MAG: D-TA family PLP-dependent enzyme [Saprospiraceae bacterium]